MYSVVLMMALSGGTESVDFGHRCSGGCSGYACSGCYGGGCYGGGCFGGGCHGRRHHRCHGCSGGCWGGCSGMCSGGWGGCSGGVGGCSGGWGCAGGMGGCYGGAVMPGVTPAPAPAPAPAPMQKSALLAPATIVVSLPADATLTVDGRATASMSTVRTFVTPALPQGEYVYTLRASIVRDGQAQAQTQQVTVRGGETTRVPFAFPSTSVASR